MSSLFSTDFRALVITYIHRFGFQEAMMKDTLERAKEPNLNLKGYLQNAYIHPVFKNDDEEDDEDHIDEKLEESLLVATKRSSRRSTPAPSKYSSGSSPSSLPESVPEDSGSKR